VAPGSAEELLRLFGKLSAEDADVFRNRAHSLARVYATGERSGMEAFAVIRLDSELFGLGLEVVHEFAHLRGITPLPCCPPHIAGNMNLRGDILTLVDIRPALGMAIGGAMSEVVVVRSGDLHFGLPASEIVDVIHLAPADIVAIPVASDRAGKAYCKGVATADGQAVGILDLEKILAARELQVAEEVQ
jgi:purine-binding chemotaxis protein CheW